MTAHSSRLPMGLAPLIAEAKHRMRRRRVLVAVLLAIAGGALGLSFALRSSASGPDPTGPLASSLRTGDLRISVPPGFRRFAFRGGIYRTGTRPPVIGYLITDVSLPAHDDGWTALDQLAPGGDSAPPANGVALVLRLPPMGPTGPHALHLPLTLGQSLWTQEKLSDGVISWRYGRLNSPNQEYEVMYWSGPAAPSKDRAAILRALKSIRPAR